jgi:putative transposase
MYDWRKMTLEQREEALAIRKTKGYPWHGPPHKISDQTTLYHLSAACYEHQHILGYSFERMTDFEEKLLKTVAHNDEQVLAWSLLPNHYHLFIDSPNILTTIHEVGQLHGRTSYDWNLEENKRGRKCWHRCVERAMRSERHQWATLNYVLHNPVHHGYVEHWQDWPFSNARQYLEAVGRETVISRWKEYPILDYGKGWDDPEM